MPDSDIDLGYAIGLPPERAIDYFAERGKNIEVIGNWREMWQQSHARAFTVANGMKQEIVKDIHDGLDKALKNGLTEKQFIEALEPKLKARGWWGMGTDKQGNAVQLGSPHRLKTIYNTNMQTTYAAAHYESDMAAVDDAPFWRYDALNDARTRPSHAALDNLVFRYDDPFWETHYPPNGFNCRCMVRSLTEDDLEDKGLTVTDGSKHLKKKDEQRYGPISRDGEQLLERPTEFRLGDRVMTPDPGWNYNPAKAGLGRLQNLNINKLEAGIRSAEQAGHAAQSVSIARQSIKDGIRSDHFKHFINGTKPADGNQWPVATITGEKLREMGLPADARVVRMESKNAISKNHRQRYSTFTDEQWVTMQDVIDNGKAISAGEFKGAVWHQGKDGLPWLVLISHRKGGKEIYLKTAYAPDRGRNYINEQVAKWQRALEKQEK